MRISIKSLFIMKPAILVGGQAVIEGVMMRVPGAVATAVRDPKGKILIKRKPFFSVIEKSPFWKKPVLRGAASLFEAMKLGYSTLQWSADIAIPPEEPDQKQNKFADIFTTFFSVGLALFLFLILPLWITTKFLNVEKDAFWFNLISGGFRITFFVIYLALISMLKDVRRLFKYHGSEHKVVYNFESGQELTIQNAQSFPTQHPRCGTSFLFIVLLSAILIFAVVDTVIISVLGTISLPIRLLFHIPMIPIVSGIGYEVIKLTARNESLIFRILRKPGLWLQNITTRPPEDDMVEVAIEALKSAFGDEYEKVSGKEYVAEAIG
jgi:uncharacterized protein YqhQ